jgi:hypothetical protein
MVLQPFCLLGCSSVVVVEGVCVRDCRGMGLCTVGTIDQSVGRKHQGGRRSEVLDRRT